MKLEWMGEYRDFVEKMIKFGNAYAARYQKEMNFGSPIPFSPTQLQTMEYILENEEKHQNMGEIAARLGISSSAFSKNVKKMVEKGLLEKYHTADNRKNVIVRVSPLGREVYKAYTAFVLEHKFGAIFRILDGIPREYVDQFARIADIWATYPPEHSPKSQGESKPVTLIKIE